MMKNKFRISILLSVFILLFSVGIFSVTDWDRAVRDSVLTETKMLFKSGADSGTSLVITNNAVTIDESYVIVDTFADASTGTLSTLNVGVETGRYSGVKDGDFVVVRQELASQDITIDEAGNIDLGLLDSITLGTLSDRAIFQYDEDQTSWILTNAPIGTATDTSFAIVTANVGNFVTCNVTTYANIDGGVIDGTIIGGASAAAGTFTDLVINAIGSFVHGGATITRNAVSIEDDAEVALPAGTGIIRVFVEGDNEYGSFHIQDDGTVVTASVLIGSVDSLDIDSNLVIYDAGSNASIKNRLGGTKTVVYEFVYK